MKTRRKFMEFNPALDRRSFVKGSLASLIAGSSSPLAFGQLPKVPFLLFVHCDGGWDPTMVFDNQIGNENVHQEPGAYNANQGIPYVAHGDRPDVDSFFNTYGAGCSFANGIGCQSMAREPAIKHMLGAKPEKLNRQVDWMTYYAANMNPLASMPHLAIAGPYMPGEYASSTVFLNHPMIGQYTTAIPKTDALGPGEKALQNYQNNQNSGAKGILTEVNPKSLDYEKLRAISAAYAREPAVLSNINNLVSSLGTQSSESDFSYSGKLAVEAFAAGMSQCATIRCGSPESWDTTRDHYNRQTDLYNELFSGLKSILDHAQTKNMEEDSVASRMVVIVTSERGRNPRLNQDAGKGPWSYTSAMLWGQIIQGGQILTQSDSFLRGAQINPLVGRNVGSGDITITMQNVMAAIFAGAGLNSSKILKDVSPLIPLLRTNS